MAELRGNPGGKGAALRRDGGAGGAVSCPDSPFRRRYMRAAVRNAWLRLRPPRANGGAR